MGSYFHIFLESIRSINLDTHTEIVYGLAYEHLFWLIY